MNSGWVPGTTAVDSTKAMLDSTQISAAAAAQVALRDRVAIAFMVISSLGFLSLRLPAPCRSLSLVLYSTRTLLECQTISVDDLGGLWRGVWRPLGPSRPGPGAECLEPGTSFLRAVRGAHAKLSSPPSVAAKKIAHETRRQCRDHRRRRPDRLRTRPSRRLGCAARARHARQAPSARDPGGAAGAAGRADGAQRLRVSNSR